ncbi:MAG: inorganic pyrophosphatase Ppa [Deltaproteobacteria bacterium]|nr:inorganic pyrophosphatase Ppa [Deltaproteobacteria bacterium]
MSNDRFLQKAEKFEIQTYKRPKNFKSLKKSHVAFSGSPQKHPHDSEKVILVSDPFSTSTFYFEFKKKDVTYVEELPNLVNLEGEIVPMARIWIKKMSVGVRCTPFLVEDTRPKET